MSSKVKPLDADETGVFDVKIKTVFDDKIISLSVNRGSTVGKLKELFGKMQGVDPPRVSFFHEGARLQDDLPIPAPQAGTREQPPILHAVVANSNAKAKRGPASPVPRVEEKPDVKNPSAVTNAAPAAAAAAAATDPPTSEVPSSDEEDIPAVAAEDTPVAEIEITDAQLRLAWKSSSWVEIYSNTKRKWYLGHIVKKFDDTEGEWLELAYETERNGQSMRKQVQRFCQDVRPINTQSWKSRNRELPPKAAENQRELRRYVRKCVTTVRNVLDRPVDLTDIDAQIKEVQNVMEEEGRLHSLDRLRLKLKILNGSALEDCTKKAKTYKDIPLLEDAISKYGPHTNPNKTSRAKEKLKALQTNRVDSIVQFAKGPEDIPTLENLLNDPQVRNQRKKKVEEKLNELKNARILEVAKNATGLEGIKAVQMQIEEDGQAITDDVKAQVDKKLQELRTDRVNDLLQIDDLAHLENTVEEWRDVLDEATKEKADARVQALRTQMLQDQIMQSEKFTDLDTLVAAIATLERKTANRRPPPIKEALQEARNKVTQLVSDHFKTLLEEGPAVENAQLVEYERAFEKGKEYCPPPLAKKLRAHLVKLCEDRLEQCIKEASAADPASTPDKLIDELAATFNHTKSHVPGPLLTKARALLRELSTHRLQRAVKDTTDTDGLKYLRARFETDSEYASDDVKKEAQAHVEMLLERQLNELVIAERIPREMVIPGGGNIIKGFDSFERLFSQKMEECKEKFGDIESIPELESLLKSTNGLENLVYERRMRELRAERIKQRVISNRKLNVEDFESFYREDEPYCEFADKTAAQDTIREMRRNKLKEIMEFACDPAAALEREIRAGALWVEDAMQEEAKQLLKELRQESLHKQTLNAIEKATKQMRENRLIPEDAQRVVNTCVEHLQDVWKQATLAENGDKIAPFSEPLQQVQNNLQVLQHYQLRQNWVVGSKVETLDGNEWNTAEVLEAVRDTSGDSVLRVRTDATYKTDRCSRLDPRVRPATPQLDPLKRRQMKMRRANLARYGMNISDVEEQLDEEVMGYDKFLGMERKRVKEQVIEEESQVEKRWAGCKAKDWGEEDIVKWLNNLGKNYQKYAEPFRAQHVTGVMLLELDENDLIELKVSRLHRRKLKIEIQKLRNVSVINNVPNVVRKSTKRRNSTSVPQQPQRGRIDST